MRKRSRCDTFQARRQCLWGKYYQNEDAFGEYADATLEASVLLGGFAFFTLTQFTKETLINIESPIRYIIWIGLLMISLLSIAGANILGLSRWLKSRGLPIFAYVGTGKGFFVAECAVFALILPFIAYAVSEEWVFGVVTAIIDLAVFIFYKWKLRRAYSITINEYKRINNLPNWKGWLHPDFDPNTYDYANAL